MRKNSIRKLIHGILDLLPLFVIPIFAININQKSVEPISIEVQEQSSVNFNQKQKNGNFTDGFNYFTSTNASASVNNQIVNIVVDNTATTFKGIRSNDFYFTDDLLNHVFYCSCYANSNYEYVYFGQLYTSGYQQVTNDTNQFTHVSNRFTVTINNSNYRYFALYYGASTSSINVEINATNIFIVDLTQMYGVGNEPTKQECDDFFTNSYYPYTESQKMLVDKPTPTTYDDTDIGSQFLYSLYISTDNYFNMNNVFNLNSVYSWFEMNIFGGSAPLSIYIVWNIIIYELVMDLLMLLYALFMFFIDACQKLIDKPLESIK